MERPGRFESGEAQHDAAVERVSDYISKELGKIETTKNSDALHALNQTLLRAEYPTKEVWDSALVGVKALGRYEALVEVQLLLEVSPDQTT